MYIYERIYMQVYTRVSKYYTNVCVCTHTCSHPRTRTHMYMGWLRLVGSLKL